jgi:hypothetical protein
MWGIENWGEMIWGGMLPVPLIGPLGLLTLAVCLLVGARGIRRRATPRWILYLVGSAPLVVPLVVWATVSLPHTFVNNTVADADEVNANFDEVVRAIEAFDPALSGVLAGEIRIGVSPPPGWLPCDGKLLPIADYVTLFEAIGNTYGGDGRIYLALPNDPGKIIAASEEVTRRNPPIDQARRFTGGAVPGAYPVRFENLPLQFNSVGTIYLALELVQHSAGVGTVWLAIPKSHDLEVGPTTPRYVLAPDVVTPTS